MQAESRERPGRRWHGANASSKCVPGEPGALSDFQGFNVPDLVGVLQDRAVAGEDAHAGDVDDGLPVPGVLVAVQRIDLLLRGHVIGEVGQQQVGVLTQQRIGDRAEAAGIVGRPEAAADLQEIWK